MTIDEAILYHIKVAEENESYYNMDGFTTTIQTHKDRAEECRQIASWLVELRDLRAVIVEDDIEINRLIEENANLRRQLSDKDN